MKALLVLYAGGSGGEAVLPVYRGKNSFSLAFERCRLFPGLARTLLLAGTEGPPFAPPGDVAVVKKDWTVALLLETLAAESAGFDLVYFAWADCPFLDPALADRLAQRHLSYAAGYSYADGWPYGIAPEILSPETAGILARLRAREGDDSGVPERGSLFAVIQKDINAFDIETEVSPVDLRCHRLNLCADSRRNLLLLERFAQNGIPDAAGIERLVAENPELLRTLPAYFPVQVSGGCPQACPPCPWGRGGNAQRRDFMDAGRFEMLVNKIADFAGDAVIGLSLWGELALHSQRLRLIAAVLARPELSLVIETSGIGWAPDDARAAADFAGRAAAQKFRRKNLPAPLSWIVSLDTGDQARYREIRGAGFAEATCFAEALLPLFPRDAYVQAVRTEGAEDDIEKFYRLWKEKAGAARVIIQKYDDFCGALPRLQASDLSPVRRRPCWHLMRDMPVLIDGTVPLCRQFSVPGREGNAVTGNSNIGNAFGDTLETLWENGQKYYGEHTRGEYGSLCADCDEYYTYNF